MELSEIRENIDRIDKQIIKLFAERMECAKLVGEYKKEHNIPILNEEREKEILDSTEKSCGEYGSSARILFGNIMELSRALQHDIVGSGSELRNIIENSEKIIPSDIKEKVAIQGIKGANSSEAAVKIFPNGELHYYNTFEDVFAAIDKGECSFGVLPVENSSAGSVMAVYDLLLKYRFYICTALNLKIDNCICGIKQSELEDITEVWSHPQALAQCSNYINEHHLKAVTSQNTAVAARDIANEKRLTCAAVCSKGACSEYGLKVLLENFQNNPNNSTRFIVISKKLYTANNADKISLCFSLPHVTGSLYSVLCRFSSHGLNLTKIESRPMENGKFEYLFYLDFTGNVKSEGVINLLCALYNELPEFSFLGNYSEQ